jgi:hypothetical protein
MRQTETFEAFEASETFETFETEPATERARLREILSVL